VKFVPVAAREYDALPDRERAALQEAIQKLKALGDQLGAPHSSKVLGIQGSLRELRPRRGSSPIRAFYRRIGDFMVIGAVGPEANVDRRGFNRAVTLAVDRLDEFRSDEEAG
jgi:hypothetical protein